MDGPEVLIPLAFFVFLGAVIICPIWLRERTKQSTHRLLSQAIERGEKIDPEVIARLSSSLPKPRRDRARSSLGSAVIMIALAGGLTVANYVNDHDFSGWETGATAVLGALGIAFLVLAIVDYRSKPRNGEAAPQSTNEG